MIDGAFGVARTREKPRRELLKKLLAFAARNAAQDVAHLCRAPRTHRDAYPRRERSCLVENDVSVREAKLFALKRRQFHPSQMLVIARIQFDHQATTAV